MKPFEEPIYITRPFLPPLEKFTKGLEEIWESHWLTNDGPIVQRFRNKLKKFLNIDNISIFANGTLALQIGLQALEVSGEVITTPFTFVATTHALYWNKIRPVFCDIEPISFTLDPEKIEEAITPWTSAILAVHIFGNPCNLDALEKISKKYNLKLIYDSAHAFGVEVNNKPINSFGNLSMNSFHATKPFHSFEGGMLAFKDSSLQKKIDYLKNFGFENEEEVVIPGTNAKMTEIHALMGIQMLDYFDEIVEKRRKIFLIYKERLDEIPGIILLKEKSNVKSNYSYMPIRIEESSFGMNRDILYGELKKFNIFTRKYFYPLICDYPCYKSVPLSHPLDNARKVSSSILTLPIYPDLPLDSVHKICDILAYIKNNNK